MVSEIQISDSFRRLTYFQVFFTFFLMILGGYVKAIGAGLSCPDWPLCYGKLFPFFDDGNYPYSPWMIFSEWFHRLVAVTAGIIMIIIVFKSKSYADEYPKLFNLSILGLILFITQGLWGGLTVLRNLNEFIVIAHLGNALLILILEMLIAFYTTIYSGAIKLD